QRGAPRHQAIGSVARRRVGDHADDPAVDEAFLLGEIGAKGQADFARAGLDRSERGADQRHGFLPGKTFADVVHGEPAKLLDVYVNVNWAYTARHGARGKGALGVLDQRPLARVRRHAARDPLLRGSGPDLAAPRRAAPDLYAARPDAAEAHAARQAPG